MAFHHRFSHTSSSSLSLSRTSHASTSSSQSSPSPASSPPKSATKSLLPHQSRSVSSRPCTPSLSPSSAIVPFKWEEKPGVLKKTIMECSLAAVDVHKLDEECACTAVERANVRSLGILDTSYAQPRPLKAPTFCQRSPHICLPPCLSNPELKASTVEGCDFLLHSRPSCGNHCAHAGASSAVTVRSKIMSSLSLHKRGHHRRTSSLDDDPFWLAMVHCTNDEDKATAVIRPKGCSKTNFSHKASKNDSWLARRIEDNVLLDRCMPRHGASENHEITRKIQIDRGQYKSINQVTRCGTVGAGASKSGDCPTSRSADDVHSQNARDINLGFKHSDHSSTKPLKALSMAKTELQVRCKALLHRQSPPVVDISCSSHRTAMSKKAHAFKS